MVKGILKHKTPDAEPAPNPEIDRQQVLENTRANAALYGQNSEKIRRASTGKVRVDEASSGTAELANGQPSDISWDEAGIYLHEQDKGTYMKIDEPKTPYAGTLGDNEYYAEDDEEATGFSLGEAEFDEDGTLEKERIIKDDSVIDEDDDEEDEREQLREEDQQHHDEFLKKRNQHYNMKIDLAAARKLAEQEEEDDE